MRLSVLAFISFLLINVFVGPAAKDEKRTSVAARQNPVVRAYFKQRALSLQPSLADDSSKRNLDMMIDLLIDDFTDKTLELTEKLVEAAKRLRELRGEHIANKDQASAGDRASGISLWREVQEQARNVRSTAKELQNKLELLSLGQKVDVKSLDEDEGVQNTSSALDGAIDLYSLAVRFKRKIEDFFFPSSNAVSIEELRTASFPVLLKKIERRAEALEETAKRVSKG